MRYHLLAPGPRDRALVASDDTLADLRAVELSALVAAGDAVIQSQLLRRLGAPEISPEELPWRHALVADALRQPEAFRALYDIAARAAALERKAAWLSRETSVHAAALRCRELYGALVPLLEAFAAKTSEIDGTSDALRHLRALLATLCDPQLLHELDATVTALRPSGHLEISMGLGPTNLPAALWMHAPGASSRSWWSRRRSRRNAIVLAPQDQAATDALRDLVARAMAPAVEVAVAGARAYVELMVGLRDELAWVVGAVALVEALGARGFPVTTATSGDGLAFSELVDPVLALATNGPVVANSLPRTDAEALVVRGANSGGKTTWLRALGLALLSARAGLPVAAREFHARPTSSVATLVPQAEAGDAGLLAHELERASCAIESLRPDGWLLANEPFRSTHAYLSSHIIGELASGLCQAKVRVALVTHVAPAKIEAHVLALATSVDHKGRPTYLIEPGVAPEGARGTDLLAELGGWPA